VRSLILRISIESLLRNLNVRWIDVWYTWLLLGNQLIVHVFFFLYDPLLYTWKRKMRSCCSSIASRTFSGYEMGLYRLKTVCSSLYVRHINTFVWGPFSFLFLVISFFFVSTFRCIIIFCKEPYIIGITFLHFSHECITNVSQYSPF